VKKNNSPAGGTEEVVHQSSLRLSTATLRLVGAHRRRAGGVRTRLRAPEELADPHRLSARHATTLLRALLVLTNTEVAR
jgi:hypothetical protein